MTNAYAWSNSGSIGSTVIIPLEITIVRSHNSKSIVLLVVFGGLKTSFSSSKGTTSHMSFVLNKVWHVLWRGIFKGSVFIKMVCVIRC